MMRVLGALLVSVAILGGLWTFLMLRNQQRPTLAPRQVTRVSDEYEIEVTLTFDAEPDDFALDPNGSASMIVEHQGDTVYARVEPIEAGTSIGVPLQDRLVVGANELYIRVTPSAEAAPIQRAIRVRVQQGDFIVADESIWAEPGAPVEGPVRFVVPGKKPNGGA